MGRPRARKAATLVAAFLLFLLATSVAAQDQQERAAAATEMESSATSTDEVAPEPRSLSGEELAAEREAVLAADRGFAEALEAKNRDGIQDALQTDATYLGMQVRWGRVAYLDELRALWEPEKKVSAEYEPLEAVVATSGDLAYSLGRGTIRFTRLGTDEVVESTGQYLTIWTRNLEGAWKIWSSGTLVVHPDPAWGLAREPRYGLAKAWKWRVLGAPEAEIDLSWRAEKTAMAASGKMAAVLGGYEVSARLGEDEESGRGGYLAVRMLDDAGQWRTVAEAYTPPMTQ